MNAAANTAHRKPRPWWMELALVDFRHAFWPWVVYVAAVMALWLMPLGPFDTRAREMSLWLWIIAVVALAGPALVARIYATDFTNGTMSTIVTSPRSRSSIWFVRSGGAVLLLFLPIILCAIPLPHPWTSWESGEQFILAAAVVTLASMAWCYATAGALLAILLKRPLLVWSAILISLIISILLFALIDSVTGLDLLLEITDQPESPLNAAVWFNLVIGVIAYIIAWRLWLRLEVRS